MEPLDILLISYNVLPVLQIETRGLPAGVVGPIRVMTIEGIDENMCCGTHVSNLSHLQVTVTCLSSLGYLISLNILLIKLLIEVQKTAGVIFSCWWLVDNYDKFNSFDFVYKRLLQYELKIPYLVAYL